MMKRIAPLQWVLIAAAILCAVLAGVCYFADALPVEEEALLISRHKTGVGMLTEDSPVSQVFTAQADTISAVEVMVSNYNKKVSQGELTLWLEDAAGKELARLTAPVREIKNNAFLTLQPESPIPGCTGKAFTLRASSTCTEGKGVTLRMGPVENDAAGLTLTLQDGTEDRENALNLRIHYLAQSRGVMACAAMLLLALCFAGSIPLAKGKERARR